MRKTLARIGDSTGLILDKPLLKLLGLEQGDPVELDIVDGRLVVTPLSGAASKRRAAVAKLREKMQGDLGSTLKKLAK